MEAGLLSHSKGERTGAQDYGSPESCLWGWAGLGPGTLSPVSLTSQQNPHPEVPTPSRLPLGKWHLFVSSPEWMGWEVGPGFKR